MISLKTPQEPYTIEVVGGFTVTVKPLTTLGYSVATMTAQAKITDLEKGLKDVEEAGFMTEMPVNLRDPLERNALYLDYLIKELATAHIVAWTGVWDEDGDKEAAPTDTNIRKVMDISEYAERFFQLFTRYVFLLGEARERIRKLTAWHYKKSGGPSYCATCKEQDLPCAYENLCPYQKYQPQILQEQQAWEILESITSQLKIAPSGKILGIDMGAALALAKAKDCDLELVVPLLQAGEAGLLETVSGDAEDDTPHSDNPYPSD